MKRVFGNVEWVFDGLYLLTALTLGAVMLATGAGNTARMLAGCMAIVLAAGDSFHLLPRMAAIRSGDRERLRPALGRGKQITSITMTAYYLLMWHIGLTLFAPRNAEAWMIAVYALGAARVALCLLPQNGWRERFPPLKWAILRNIPFLFLGALVAGLFFVNAEAAGGLRYMGFAIALSFACYLPVVLWADKAPGVGALMLPKTCAYVWMLIMCLTL